MEEVGVRILPKQAIQVSYPEDPCWYEILTYLPVTNFIMQYINRSWFEEKNGNLNSSNPAYLQQKENLLKKAIKYEKGALAGHAITAFVVGIISILSSTVAPVAIFGVLGLCSFKILRNSSARLAELNSELVKTQPSLAP